MALTRMVLAIPGAIGIVVLSFLLTSYILDRYSLTSSVAEDRSKASFSSRQAPATTSSSTRQEKNQNLIWPSQDFTHPRWTRYQTQARVNAAIAPDGSSSATSLVESSDSGRHFIYISGSGIKAGETYVFSVFFKPVEVTSIGLEIRDSPPGKYGVATCSTANGGSATKGGNVLDSGSESVGNGWYRCWAAMPFDLANVVLAMDLRNEKGASEFQGDGHSGMLIWGAQFEQGNRPTSYVANAGLVARAN